MIYKRATKQLREAGIPHIEIRKYLWGPCPIDPRLTKQTSQCFNSPQKAAQAVIDGFRPTDGRSVPDDSTHDKPAPLL